MRERLPELERLEYRRRLTQEIENYKKLFAGRMSQDVPPVWLSAEKQFADAIERKTGKRNLYAYVADRLTGRPSARVLGLGSGACGNELNGIAPLLKNQSCSMHLTCVDVNSDILAQAGIEAAARGVDFTAVVQDINDLILEPGSFDVVVAYASLHHFQELSHILKEVNRALTTDGLFVTVDIPTANGYRLWPETREIIERLWAVLPPQFKIDHTRFAEPAYAEVFEDPDLSLDSFECINSEAILPALRSELEEIDFVPAHCIVRRFLDTRFGPNFDLERPLDRAIVTLLLELDAYYLDTGRLKPETFFGAYVKKA